MNAVTHLVTVQDVSRPLRVLQSVDGERSTRCTLDLLGKPVMMLINK
jgi:hypothetical protein